MQNKERISLPHTFPHHFKKLLCRIREAEHKPVMGNFVIIIRFVSYLEK